ncbi:hypothetical protein ACFVFI_30030 [Streptomyces sp. NPDC057705]|uniref:hypothetical protein n=1 Tax=Streptomyces sp. NPDC057705 TaxID=3346222 RepID=UPI0036BAE0EF
MTGVREGWQELPNGGMVRLEDGVPAEVTDAGRWDLDERRILAEAGRLVDMPLTWAELDRARRWRHTGLASLLKASNEWRWCVAPVLRETCELCGTEVGMAWIALAGGPERVWAGEQCVQEAREGTLDVGQ